METLHQYLTPLLFVLAGGCLLPGIVGVLFSKGKRQLDPEVEAKLHQYEHDLASSRADLDRLEAKASGYQTELDVSTARLKEKEAELAELHARFNTLAAVEAELKTKDGELANLKAELDGWKLKLKEAGEKAAQELAAAQTAAPAAKLTAELSTLKLALADKETETAKLLDRIKNLAPLGLQLKDRDLRVKQLEAEIGTIATGKNDEIAQVQHALDAANQAKADETSQLFARIRELESTLGQLEWLKQQLAHRDDKLREMDNLLFDLENRVKEVEHNKIIAIAERESENQHLRLRLGELEASAAGATAELAQAAALTPELEAKLRELETASARQLGEKDAELARLHSRIIELEQAAAHARQLLAESLTSPLKDAEIARLRARISQLEQADAVLRNRQADAEADQVATLKDKDDSIALLQWRVKELEPLTDHVVARDGRLKDLAAQLAAVHEHLIATVNSKDDELARFEAQLVENRKASEAEINRLALRLHELEGASALATGLQAQLRVEQNERAAESAAFQMRLAEREAELANWQREWADTLNHKDAEIHHLHGQLNALDQSRQQTVAMAEEEIGKLRWRIGELDAFLSNRDEEIGQLKWRLGELEAFLGQRDEEIGQLKWRLGELEALGRQLADRDARLAERDAKLREREAAFSRQLTEKDDELGTLRWRVSELEVWLGQRDAQLGELETRLHTTLQSKEREIAQLAGRINELSLLSAQLTDRETKANAWQTRYREVVSERDGEIARLTARLVELGTLNVHAHVEIGQLRAQFDELQARARQHATVKPEAASAVSSTIPKETTDAPPKPARKKKASARAVMETYRKNHPRKGEYDDLKLLHGIGPALEELLHKLGIYFFKQVATLDETDIDYVDTQLERFKGRIRRENWVAGAQEEHFKKYGEKL